MVDIHCHLTHSPLDEIRDAILQRCKQLEIKYLIDCVTSLDRWESQLILAESNVFLTLGIHPQSVQDFNYDNWLKKLENFASSPKVVAIGEIGFDKFKHRADYSIQQKIFYRQLEIAEASSLPLVVHCRGYYDQLLKILKQEKITVPIILHRYTGGDGQVNAFSKLGCYFSFSANILNPQNKKALHSIQAVPFDLLLAETDAPYFSEDLQSWGTPCSLPKVIQTISGIKKIETMRLREIIDENIKRSFQGRIPV